MIGLGLDVVELDRFRRILTRTPTFTRRVFTADEVAYADARRDSTERYAVRFAAKEAVLKAMSIGLWSCPLSDIEVVRAESGAPSLTLHGRAGELADERQVTQWHLTLCHTDRIAVALAVALGDGPPMTAADAAELGRSVAAQLVEADADGVGTSS
jgi:holo-[acyl-carrier protein] synthase